MKGLRRRVFLVKVNGFPREMGQPMLATISQGEKAYREQWYVVIHGLKGDVKCHIEQKGNECTMMAVHGKATRTLSETSRYRNGPVSCASILIADVCDLNYRCGSFSSSTSARALFHLPRSPLSDGFHQRHASGEASNSIPWIESTSAGIWLGCDGRVSLCISNSFLLLKFIRHRLSSTVFYIP